MKLEISDLKDLGYKGIAGMVLISIVLAVIYNFLTGFPFVIGILAMLVGVFGSYLVLMSFEKEITPPPLEEDEYVILRSIEQASVLFPEEGGFLSSNAQKFVNLYLTNKRVIGHDETIKFQVFLSSIQKAEVDRKMFREYIRVYYLQNNEEKNALLVVGDTELWKKKLKEQDIQVK